MESLGLQLMSDVRGRNGPEKLALLADARGKGERDLLEFGGLFGGGAASCLFCLLETLALLLDALPISGSCLVGKAAWQ